MQEKNKEGFSMQNKSGIKHIEFWVSDLSASLKFYEQLFVLIGWKKVDVNAFSDGITKIYFTERVAALQPSLGPRHICFLADSIEMVNVVGELLKTQHVSIIRGPLESWYKDRSSYTVDFKDPDGYILEVATRSMPVHEE